MDDLEMTRLCAEAMGIATEESFGVLAAYYREGTGLVQEVYDPLSNDAQAMALVKRFGIVVEPYITHGDDVGYWNVRAKYRLPTRSINSDLNRAIVECVAKMHAARSLSER